MRADVPGQYPTGNICLFSCRQCNLGVIVAVGVHDIRQFVLKDPDQAPVISDNAHSGKRDGIDMKSFFFGP